MSGNINHKNLTGTDLHIPKVHASSHAVGGSDSISALSTAGENLIINGAMDIAQRGTSFAAITTGAYSVDRFQYVNETTAVHTITQDTDVPTVAQAGCKFNNSLKIDCTTADAVIDAGVRCMLAQHIEGYNIRNIMEKSITLSFWVKATKTGIYCVSGRNNGADRSYIAEYTVNTTNTWEKKTVTLTMHDGSSGTWNYTNLAGLTLFWDLAIGSVYQSTAGSWLTGNYHATANQVNACDSTDNNFWLTGVQLELGSVATDFEIPSIDRIMNQCLRYYEILGGEGGVNGRITYGGAITTGGAIYSTLYYARKRATPTVTIFGTWGVDGCNQPSIAQPGLTSCQISNGGGVAGQGDCYTNSADDYVEIKAEL